MRLDSLFRTRPATTAGRALYARAVDQSRSPVLYGQYAAPDTVEGRFELYTLHVVILLDRLRRQGPRASDTAQALFDAYVSALDHALREMGVGDLSVGKKMRKLGEAFFGRVKSYEGAFKTLPAAGTLEEVIARTVYADGDPSHAPALAAYAVRQRDALATQDLAALLEGRVEWLAA